MARNTVERLTPAAAAAPRPQHFLGLHRTGHLPAARMRYGVFKVTWVTPEKPSDRAAAGVTSITRPRTKGPRSLMVTMTERPLRLFVTFTLLPSGSVPCAAVSAPPFSF
jgi:hypothetical protein